MHHPLIGYARRVRPEQAVLEVLARIPGFIREIREKALPVGILLLDGRDELGPAPPPGLVHVPGHLGHDDIAELSRSDEVIGDLVVLVTAPLRAYLHDAVRLLDRIPDLDGLLPRVLQRLLYVGVLPRSVGDDASV